MRFVRSTHKTSEKNEKRKEKGVSKISKIKKVRKKLHKLVICFKNNFFEEKRLLKLDFMIIFTYVLLILTK